MKHQRHKQHAIELSDTMSSVNADAVLTDSNTQSLDLCAHCNAAKAAAYNILIAIGYTTKRSWERNDSISLPTVVYSTTDYRADTQCPLCIIFFNSNSRYKSLDAELAAENIAVASYTLNRGLYSHLPELRLELKFRSPRSGDTSLGLCLIELVSKDGNFYFL